MLDKILSMATVGSTLASLGLLHRFFLNMLNIMILGIVCAFTLCASLACVFYLLYVGLIHLGVPPDIAGLSLCAAVIIITVVLVILTADKIQKLRQVTHTEPHTENIHWINLWGVAEAFTRGFLKESR